MSKTALLFPGQGSQAVGMGHDLYQEYDTVRELFDMAEEISRINLSRLCFHGPIEALTETVALQPAVTAVNLSLLAVIEKEGATFDITAGHSLGEYSALKAAGVLSSEDVFRIVTERGRLMHRESMRYHGVMSAVIGLSVEQVADCVSSVQSEINGAGRGIGIANHNAGTQIVVSGDPESVKLLSARLKEIRGRTIPLKVSGAWHSPLIQGAENEFREFLGQVSFNSPKKAIVFNTSAEWSDDPSEIKNNMVNQLCSPVRWFDSMNRIMEAQASNFVEAGPGNVLSGLVKKSLPKESSAKIYSVNDMKSLELFFKDGI